MFGMKKISKPLQITGIIILIIGVVFSLIHDFIYNWKDTLYGLGLSCVIGVLFFGFMFLHNFLLNKNKIDWEKYKDLNYSAAFLGVAVFLILLVAVISCLSEDIKYHLYSLLMLFLEAFIVVVTWLTFLFAKSWALFLFRATSILISSFLLYVSFVTIYHFSYYQVNNYYSTFTYLISILLFSSLAISLCTKGLIISFRSHWKKSFQNQKFPFFGIFVFIILFFALIILRKLEFGN